jgi:hypothetical protein
MFPPTSRQLHVHVRIDVFAAVTMKNAVFWKLNVFVALVRNDISEEFSTSFIRVTRIGELGTTPAVTGNRRMLLVTASVVHLFLSL